VNPSTIGIVHPGAMGASVAATLRNAGHDVLWASQGRSESTRARADRHGLRDVGTVAELCRASAMVVSVCPPHVAEEVAREVVEAGFGGVFLDANAISPERAQTIAARVEAGGGSFVDGGIVGGPAVERGTTWLHLSGPRAAEVAEAFVAGPLEVSSLGARVGDASALKMCFAAYTKGVTALLAAAMATASHHGVLAALAAQWEHVDPGFIGRSSDRVRRSTRKAWRFEGEMHEIDATFGAAGVPAGFHAAAARTYARLAGLDAHADPDGAEPPDLETVLRALRGR
jgi:3-hydroxyisobutyrate dehydrogenase-like beta-hydroxyacid dehydrogenase